MAVNGFGLDLYVCYYEFPSNQGQFTEVPLSFEIFVIKVVGQSIKACSTTKISRLQSNGIVKLGLANVYVLYCSGTPKKSCKSKLNLVTGF